MTRYEYIANGGIEEMAKALSFVLVRSISDECEFIKEKVPVLMPDMIEWLKEEVEA
jgi:hypothetical protein